MVVLAVDTVMAGFEGVIPFLVVAAVIIYQIRKAMKKAQQSRGTSPGQTEAPPSLSPEEALRKFLGSLQKGIGQASQPPPLPPRPAAPLRQAPQTLAAQRTSADQWQVNRQAAQKRKDAKRSKVGPPTAVPVMPIALPAPEPADRSAAPMSADAYEHAGKPPKAPAVGRLRAALGSDLVNKESVQKAMVLSEILGRPLALRGPAAPGTRS
jgi:hypothetical protein